MAKKSRTKKAKSTRRPTTAPKRTIGPMAAHNTMDPNDPRSWGGDVGRGEHVESITDPTQAETWGGNREHVAPVGDPKDPRSWGGGR